MLGLILMSSLELCFADVNVEPGSTKGRVLYVLDIFFTIAFGIEVNDAVMICQNCPLISLLPGSYTGTTNLSTTSVFLY